MPSLVRANIFQRKTRAAITMMAVAIEVMAVLLIVGITNGTLNEVSDRMQAVGADIMVRPVGSSPIFGMTSTSMPAKQVIEMLEAFPGVAAAAPIYVHVTTGVGEGSPVNMWGIDARFEDVGVGLDFLEGRNLSFQPGAFEMVVDRRLASAADLSVGDTLRDVLNSTWRIVGIAGAGIGARIFVPLEILQELVGQDGRAHAIFIKADDLAQVGSLATRIENDVPQLETSLLEEYAEALYSSIVGLNQFNAAISGIAVVLSFLVILLAMYTSIIERTREIGILKALGGSKTYIVLTIMQESMILSALGVVGGYGLARLSAAMLIRVYPTLTVEFNWDWTLYASALGILGGIMGSFYPAIRAALQDPVRALRDE